MARVLALVQPEIDPAGDDPKLTHSLRLFLDGAQIAVEFSSSAREAQLRAEQYCGPHPTRPRPLNWVADEAGNLAAEATF